MLNVESGSLRAVVVAMLASYPQAFLSQILSHSSGVRGKAKLVVLVYPSSLVFAPDPNQPQCGSLPVLCTGKKGLVIILHGSNPCWGCFGSETT